MRHYFCVATLQEPHGQSSAAERHSHSMAVQALEKQAKEDVLSERNRLQTIHHLELGSSLLHTHTHTLRLHGQMGTLTQYSLQTLESQIQQ